VVQLIEHTPIKLVGWLRFLVGHAEDLKNGTCGVSSLVLDVDGWVQETVLPLTRRQCNIHCESSRVAHCWASKRR